MEEGDREIDFHSKVRFIDKNQTYWRERDTGTATFSYLNITLYVIS